VPFTARAPEDGPISASTVTAVEIQPSACERPATVVAVLSYLDAQTGSMIVAAFAGGAAGIAVLLRMYGNRLLGVISKTHRARAEEAKARLLGDADH
jgi:hypothetical protein